MSDRGVVPALSAETERLFWEVSQELGADGWQPLIAYAHTVEDEGLRGITLAVSEMHRVTIDVNLGTVAIADLASGYVGNIPLPSTDT